jgi:hypothetical protein
VKFTQNHRFEFPHFAENVDLRRIGGGVCAFFAPPNLPARTSGATLRFYGVTARP